jgi:monoamine oxidase
LGVLQANENEQGAITFDPPIAKQMDAIKTMGFGAIIKILLEFDNVFWEDNETEQLAGKSMAGMGFILSDEPIPTWWTQAPQHSPVLTGWLGGPPASDKINATEEELVQLALQAVATIFKRDINWLKDKLVAYMAVNWTKDLYTRGSYAYDTVNATASRQILNAPVNNMIYFAGEYLYEGTAMGTVEAALTSGKNVAENISRI